MTLIHIDDAAVEAELGETLLAVANKAGIYVPALCAYPGLRPAKGSRAVERVHRGAAAIEGSAGLEFAGCGLCVVEVAGAGQVLACETPVQNDMFVHTNSAQLRQLRRDRLAPLLVHHPHACVFCPYGEGCDLIECTFDTPVDERCCTLFGNCELQRMAQHLGAPDDLDQYAVGHRPLVASEPLIIFNYELCVGCARCVVACDVLGGGALSYTSLDGEVIVGTTGATLKTSNCIFCGACIEVCPTTGLTDKSEKAKLVRAKKLALSPRVMPALQRALPLDAETLRSVPHAEGVYQLLDEQGEVIQIKGTEDLSAALEEVLSDPGDAVSFTFGEDRHYTSRESQLLQQFLHRYGRMPRRSLIGDDLDDLF